MHVLTAVFFQIYTTEALPAEAHVFKKSETKRYRDCVCKILKLTFKPIGGNGNCFFDSVVTLLALVPNQYGNQPRLDATELRARVIEWLLHCGASDGGVYDQSIIHMFAELKYPLTVLQGNKWVQRKPADVPEYLQLSSQDGVWVAGRSPAIHHLHHHIPPAYTTTIAHHNTPLKQLSQASIGTSRWLRCSVSVWSW